MSHCIMCLSREATMCSGCQSCAYCSDECKNQDAEPHNLLCGTMKDFGEAQRPSSSHVRAIFFSEHADQPCFVWISSVRLVSPRGGETPDDYDIEDLVLTTLDRYDGIKTAWSVTSGEVNARTMLGTPGRFVTLHHRSSRGWFESRKSIASQATAVKSTLRQLGTSLHQPWPGSVVAVARQRVRSVTDEVNGVSPEHNPYSDKLVDIEMSHYRDIIDGCTHYPVDDEDGVVYLE